MANTGDSYIVTIKRSHLAWGEYRYTGSRGIVYGEGYIKIPSREAYRLNLLNTNGTQGRDILRKNLFNCVSADGTFRCVLRAQGCSSAGEPYAKQFAGNNNLKAQVEWYYSVGAQEGDQVKVSWVNSTDIVIELIRA